MSDRNPPDNQDELYQDPYDEDLSYSESFEDKAEVDSGSSAVATAKAKSIIIMVLIGFVAIFFLYKMLFDEEEVISEEDRVRMEMERQERTVSINDLGETKQVETEEEETQVLKSIDQLPTPPDQSIIRFETAAPIILPSTDGIDVAPPAPPPAPVTAPAISGGSQRTPFPKQGSGGKLAPIIFGNESSRPAPSGGSGSSPGSAGLSEAEQMEFARRNVNSIVSGGGGASSDGGGGGGSAEGEDGVTSKGGGPAKSGGVTLFSSSSSTRNLGTAAPSKESRYIEDLYRIVGQGKIIDAVLETAINTDVPGLLRGVVTKDIFSEQGRNVLIPRGSRLIGTYNNDVERNQQRISVTWNRIIRPDGIDIEIESPGADRLGRSGITGKVDNKYVELFGSTLMFGSIGASVALLSEQFTDSGGTTTSTTDGGTTNSSGTNVDVAIQDMVTGIGDVTEAISGELLDIQPTFTVNQGTVMKIFVTEDLLFSTIYLKR